VDRPAELENGRDYALIDGGRRAGGGTHAGSFQAILRARRGTLQGEKGPRQWHGHGRSTKRGFLAPTTECVRVLLAAGGTR